MAGKANAIVAEARERFQRCEENEDAQRKRILLAKQFRAGDQWPDAIKVQRQGGTAIQGQPAQPPRPCLTIDRLSQPVRQISNTIKSANFAIDVLPNGHGADTETAEIFRGYLRYVQNRARGESPVEWAADGAIEGGLGWFRIRTEFVYDSPEGVPPEAIFDQEIRLERITNNLTVYCDPWAMKPTKSDARFMFVTEDLSREEYKQRFGKDDHDMASLDDFTATGDNTKGWINKDTIRIAEYWRITFQDETWAEMPDKSVRLVTEGEKLEEGARKRVIRRPVVKMSLINAQEELEKFDWVGSKIPLVPVLGEELNLDGKSHYRGIIEEGMDAQRMVNFTYSGAVEIFALGAKDAPIIEENQIADYKAIWQTRNIYTYGYLPYKATSIVGHPVPPPYFAGSEPPIQAAAMLMQVSEEAIRATTGIYKEGLGDSDKNVKSGRHASALQSQSDLGTSNYPDNVRRSLIYAGELMVEIAPKITRPGQLLQILGVDDKPTQVIVGQSYVEEKGVPQPVPEGQEGQYEKGLVKFYDFSKGRYAVTVDVGKSYSTKREEGAAAIMEIMPALAPPQQMVIVPEFIDNLSFQGAHKIAELARNAIPPELRPKDDKEEPIPMKAQQQIAQATQAIQMLTQTVEQQSEIIKTDQIKAQQAMAKEQLAAQADLQTAQLTQENENRRATMKIEADERKSALDNLVKLAIAEISSQTQMANTHAEQVRQEMGFQHEHAEGEAERTVGLIDSERARASASQESERDRVFQGQQSDTDRAIAMQQAEADRQAAAQQPEV